MKSVYSSQLTVGHVMKRSQFTGELTRGSQSESCAPAQEEEGGVPQRETKGAEYRS